MLIYIENAIAFVLLVFAIYCSIGAVRELTAELAAHRNFRKVLASTPLPHRLLELRERLRGRELIDVEDLHQLATCLAGFAQSLPKEQQRVIERCLFDNPVRARARFAQRALDRAGIGAGPPRVAVR